VATNVIKSHWRQPASKNSS